MIAVEVFADLRHRGVKLFVVDGVLRYRAPRGVLTPALRATLSAHRDELRAMLTAVPDTRRLTLPDCIELLAEIHAEIRATYPAGALALLPTDPDLTRRFRATEARIDDLARIPGGPGEADFRAAVEAHFTVWRELTARHRARAEQRAERADPMPELPTDTGAAVGVSYGDGAAGTWDVVRRTR
jgi:hypothetical protein